MAEFCDLNISTRAEIKNEIIRFSPFALIEGDQLAFKLSRGQDLR
jgi:hypothetical protein